ncbi:MAG TPA: HNH endonuclease [Micromonosporaceae bacterium]
MEHYQRKNLKRRAGGTRIMSIQELAERDRWRCHLCRRRVSRTLRYPHPRAASRDHLVPVVDGGTNDPANLALAHWDCNVRRRTGGSVQLQLVG